VPIHLPMGSERDFKGIVDLIRMRAYSYTPGGDGRGKEGDIPAEYAGEAQTAHEALVEMVAEGNDAYMEEFFEKGTLPELHALVSKPEELVMRYGGTLPEPWLSSRGASVSMGEPGCIRLDLGAAGMDQEEAIRTFVQEGGALFEAYRSRIDLLELLNKRIRPDE